MLSLIVPAHNEHGYLHKCLNSIISQKTEYKYEVIVVNNASTDDTKEIALDFDVKVVDVPIKGLSLAKNTGVKNAIYDFILFIDADCIIPTDYVSHVCETFIKNPQIVAFGGPYFYMDGGKLVKYVTLDLKYFYKYSNFFKKLFNVPIISGGNFAIRKDIFLEIGGFNESFTNPIEAEDLEICKRLVKSGHTIKMFPDLLVESSFRRQLSILAPISSIQRFLFTVKHLNK